MTEPTRLFRTYADDEWARITADPLTVEGFEVATPAFSDWVIPISVVILIALFAVQRRGTARVASFFGPIMLIWFVTIAVAGATHIFDDPGVFAAINPLYALTVLK